MPISDSEHKRLKEHLESQQWNKALEVTFELLGSQPESSWLHVTMGNIYHKMNELVYAETSFKSAIYYQDTNVEAYTGLGFVYLAMGRVGTADDNCRKAIALDQTYTPAWHLGFKVKLAYSDLPAAREIHSTLRRQGMSSQLLRALNFELIRHPQNKQPVDFKAEIETREAMLSEENPDHAIHEELAYLYNQYAPENEKADQHIQIALKKFPVSPNSLVTHALIQRRSPLWLRILTSPTLVLTRPKQIPHKEVSIIGGLFILISGLALLGALIFKDNAQAISLSVVLSFIGVLFVSYTTLQSFIYLVTSEVYHQHDKISQFKRPLKAIDLLPLSKRKLIVSSLTLLSWITLALLIYLLAR